MSFGEQLQAVRRKNGLTQEEFAAQLNVSRQAVSKWESSRGYPEIEKIIYICNRYGTSMDELFAEEVPTVQAAEQPAPAITEAFHDDRTLKKILADFSSNLSYGKKLMIGGLLASMALLILLTSHQLKGGTDRMMTIVWTAAIILFGVVEAATAGLVSIWFVAGALVALIAAFVDASLVVQIILFLVVSAAALALTRPMLRKITNANAVPTNADRVLGEMAKVTETIDNENSVGAVYVDGKTWSARSTDGSVIPAGSRVYIESMQGVKLLVKKSEEKVEVT
ncbi:MAG: helix-turn-helix domain-containing protein [Oscillibacter sp.]|nr:helix-turn-helix domain-containing protein [Oscillibacter sp.]